MIWKSARYRCFNWRNCFCEKSVKLSKQDFLYREYILRTRKQLRNIKCFGHHENLLPFKHAIKKFLQEDSILDVWLGSEYASGKYTFSQIIINLTLWTLATGWINLKNNLQPDLPTSKNWNEENQDKNYPKQGKIVVKREDLT